MSKYTRGTTATLEVVFKDVGGDPVVPFDSTYPQIAISDPLGVVIASGVGQQKTTPGEWNFEWAIPAGANLDPGWLVDWYMLSLNKESFRQSYCIELLDQVDSEDSLDREGAYLAACGKSERLIYRSSVQLYDVSVSARLNGTDMWSYTKDQITEVLADGIWTYYVETPSLDDSGQYLILWEVQETQVSRRDTVMQTLRVAPDQVWLMMPYLRGLLDKLGKVQDTPLSYTDSELFQYLERGADLLNCVVGSTKILTPTGLRSAVALVRSSTCSHCNNHLGKVRPGRYKATAELYQPGFGIKESAYAIRTRRVPTIKVETFLGYSLSGSYKQPILTLDKFCNMQWKNLDQVKEGDLVAICRDVVDVPVLKTGEQAAKANSYRKSGATKQQVLPTKMTKALASVIGWLVSEGDVTPRRSVVFHNTDMELHRLFRKAAKRCFPSATITTYPVFKDDLLVAHCTRIHGVQVRLYLEYVGVGYDIARDKKVPWSIFRSHKSHVAAFLKTFMDGDGSAYDKKGQFHTASPYLADGIHLLLLQLGIISNRKEKKDDSCVRGYSYEVFLGADSWRRYASAVGFSHKVPPGDELNNGRGTQVRLPATVRAFIDSTIYKPDKSLRVSVAKTRGEWIGFRANHSNTIVRPTYKQLEYYLQNSEFRHHFPSEADRLSQLLEKDFFWDPVASVEHSVEDAMTYDVEFAEGKGLLERSFVANGIVSHNSVHPATEWVLGSFPSQMTSWLILAAGWWGLNARQILEIEVSHDFQGQLVNLTYDHASPLGEIIARWETLLWERLSVEKLAIYRRAAGPGCVAVRPYRLSFEHRVFRVGSAQSALAEFPSIMGRLGILW